MYGKSSLYALVLIITLGMLPQPVLAHHALGGRLPNNILEGFLAGLAHPIIGIDHLAFIIALGLIASLYVQSSLLMTLGFILATLIGTGLHLLTLNLPWVEIAIAVSVVFVGYLLTLTQPFPRWGMILIGAIAGLFHGYAYGEAIMGAQNLTLASYLLGFSFIQSIILLIAYKVGHLLNTSLTLRFTGFTIGGMGLAFLASAILG